MAVIRAVLGWLYSRRNGIPLFLGIAVVVGLRLAYYKIAPEFPSDFTLIYHAAQHLLEGENPYPIVHQWWGYPLYYPMPAILFAVPFTIIRVEEAQVLFDVVVGSVFTWGLWRFRGAWGPLAVSSGAYLFAMRNGQLTPLITAAGVIPWLGFLLVLKPNTGLVLWFSRPNRAAVIAGAGFLALSLLVLPSWPLDWLHALSDQQKAQLGPPVLRPYGFLLLLAALRWRTPEGRLLLASALIPQNTLPHELLPLALIPANVRQMSIYVLGTWLAVGGVARQWVPHSTVATLSAAGWPLTLGAVYLPMLYLVLARPREGPFSLTQVDPDAEGKVA